MSAPVAPERVFDLLAEGLWGRLRDILMLHARWDRFVHHPEEEQPTPAPAAPPREEAERVATEMALRALRVGADPVNHAILVRLAREEAVGLPALMDLTGLPRIPLSERVNDLSQVGLASYAVETREARATPAAEGLLGLLDEVRGRLTRIMGERWAKAGAGRGGE